MLENRSLAAGVDNGYKMKKLNRTDWFQLTIFAGFHTAAILYIVFDKVYARSPDYVLPLFIIGVAVAWASVSIQTLAASRIVYFIALCVQIAACLLLIPLIAPEQIVEFLLFSIALFGICLHNPFPINLIFAFIFNVGVLTIRALGFVRSGLPAGEILTFELELGLFITLVPIAFCMMIFYREKLIDNQREMGRLDGLVERLTRANLGYQEYARTIEESSIESERKRVTRDIHDIVGYTLTNNITMMEAIKDMMRINPLGVASLVKSARENAEEGLSQVREALHILREQRIDHPKGRRAVERLINIFEQATGVHVEFVLSNGSWNFAEEVDFVLYHVIQESLMNAFRHGKAHEIRIFLDSNLDELTLKIRDNGKGASQFKEDIGIAGMRERTEHLGGRLTAYTIIDGFEVFATIPMTMVNENND